MSGPAAPAISIHSLAQAVAALEISVAGRHAIVLLSARDAGIYAGPGWWAALIEAAREALPAARCAAILDCGDDAGAAMAAIRAGVEAIVFTGRADVAERLEDIATAQGCRLLTERPDALLDLGDLFFADAETLRRRCADALASPKAIC
ncbi:MAG TPA: hypothetical protein VND87_14010 [Stellaceae bacterium]|nr:hypothetical protein [Stellaceae bacterium]